MCSAGVTLGKQTTLAPLAVPALGSTVKPKTICMGAPAQPVKVCPCLHASAAALATSACTCWHHGTCKRLKHATLSLALASIVSARPAWWGRPASSAHMLTVLCWPG